MSFGAKDNRGPSIAELQRYIREKNEMIFTLNTGKEIVGVLRWFDEHAFSIATEGEQPFTILRSAVVGYRKRSDGAPATAPQKASGKSQPASDAGDGNSEQPKESQPELNAEQS